MESGCYKLSLFLKKRYPGGLKERGADWALNEACKFEHELACKLIKDKDGTFEKD